MGLPYLIYAPSWNNKSAGVMALYQLCHDLNLMGESAFIARGYSNFTPPHLKAPLISADRPHAHINVVPELFNINPHAKGSVRYLLHYAGFMGGPHDFQSNDLLFYYSKTFVHKNITPENILSVPTLNHDLFYDKHLDRAGSVFVARKYREHGGVPNQHPEGSLELVGISHTPEYVASCFQNFKTFYTYDNTFMIEEALACGCEVVMIHNEHFTEYHRPDFENYPTQLQNFIRVTQEYFK